MPDHLLLLVAGAALAGFVQGVAGFAFSEDLQRAVLQNFNLAALAATLLSYLATGTITTTMLPALAVALPALVIPSMLGARVYCGMSPLAFRRVMLLLLSASGAVMVLGALGQWIGRV